MERPSPFVTPGGELSLSNPGQLELLRGAVERGVPLRTRVRGFSMSPFVRDGDVVTFEPFTTDPHIGDVAAVSVGCEGRMAVHRVVARERDGWEVRGDNCPQPDGVFARDAFVARVARVERDGKETRLGLGGEASLVAAASRTGWLGRARWARHAPRHAAAAALRMAQGLPAYRQAVRRLAPSVTIAEATPADFEALLRRHGIAARTQRPDVRDDDRAVHFAARAGGHTAGFVEFVDHTGLEGPWRGRWLFGLEVWPQYRGMGLGERLVQAVIDEARRREAAELLLVVNEDNLRAVALYLKKGFTGTVVPGLEPLFEEEALRTGRRRRVMRMGL